MTPADEMRAAAEKLRKLAAQATNGPWETTWRGQEYQLDGYRDGDLHPISEWTYAIVTTEPKASEQRAECDTADADYIAAMHPGVGNALASWLESVATTLTANTHSGWQEHVQPDALAVARAINAHP